MNSDAKLINKLLANQINQPIQIIYYNQMRFGPGKQSWFNMGKINVIHQMKKIKEKNHIVITIDPGNPWHDLTTIYNKDSQYTRNKRKPLNLVNGIYGKSKP